MSKDSEDNKSVGLGLFILLGGLFLAAAVLSFSPILAFVFSMAGVVGSLPLLFK